MRLSRVCYDRAGPAKLNSPMRVDTAPEGEDIARDNWSKHEQETPPHALSGIEVQVHVGTWRELIDELFRHSGGIRSELLAVAAWSRTRRPTSSQRRTLAHLISPNTRCTSAALCAVARWL